MNREDHAKAAREVIRRAYLSQDRAVTGTVRFTIKAPKSRSNQRVHWAVRHNQDRAIHSEVWAAVAAAKAMPTSRQKLLLATEKPKRTVRFIRYWGGRVREMDFGNFVASVKPVLDALKLDRIGLIFDDAPSYCVEVYEQVKDKAQAGQLQVEISG